MCCHPEPMSLGCPPALPGSRAATTRASRRFELAASLLICGLGVAQGQHAEGLELDPR